MIAMLMWFLWGTPVVGVATVKHADRVIAVQIAMRDAGRDAHRQCLQARCGDGACTHANLTTFRALCAPVRDGATTCEVTVKGTCER